MLRSFNSAIALAFAFVLFGACRTQPTVTSTNEATAPLPALPDVSPSELRPLSAFTAIENDEQRAQALFLEVSRVLLHPRCMNCHPHGDTPLQGMQQRPHVPPVVRGADDHGDVGMRCQGCHQERNLDHARVPGAPKWHVAPKEMAWVGRTPRDICEQLKDKKRNGGKSMAELIEHSTNDELVAWGWQPGHGREKAPGDQKHFGALFAAWVDAGAACPPERATITEASR